MDDIEKLVGTSMAEIEKILSTKSTVGEPITVEGYTVVPLMGINFAFAAGGGSGKGTGKGERGPKGEGSGEGLGEATGGLGGIKPVAVIIIGKDGARVESIRGGASGFAESIGNAVSNVVGKRSEAKGE
ncbi:MAG: spore germination protein GerW family protein [Dehalococcoidia bacterium]